MNKKIFVMHSLPIINNIVWFSCITTVIARKKKCSKIFYFAFNAYYKLSNVYIDALLLKY